LAHSDRGDATKSGFPLQGGGAGPRYVNVLARIRIASQVVHYLKARATSWAFTGYMAG